MPFFRLHNLGRAYNACLQILQARFQAGSIPFFLVPTVDRQKNGQKTEYYRTGILPAKFEGMHYRFFQTCLRRETAYAISTPNV